MKSQTYKEIKDQYNRLEQTQKHLNESNMEIIEKYKKYGTIIYVGCGSSYCIAKSLSVATVMKLGKESFAISGGDLMQRIAEYRDALNNSLVVAISRSGATSEILLAFENLRKENINYETLSFSCRENQELARLSDYAIEMPWAFDKSVCQTSSVTNLYFAGMNLIARAAANDEMLESLSQLIISGNEFLSKTEETLAKIAGLDWDHGVILGDSEAAGICEEGALAFKEICQLPSNHYNLLDSRHGPIVMINAKTLVVMIISNINNDFELNLIEDLKKKKCTIVTVSGEALEISGTININVGFTLPYAVLGIPFINVVQMITSYKAELLNTDPDMPEGLDPWITL
ncbi:MAG: hypothetical protein CVV02_13525 [Firmicutes bacterium HGW-Firmicutes-7]|nr:MAG: hypothetical protein CVV02_13525 [Firmicutes bacterium HGW-Firmicutes-7]